jgi:ParB family chromosome partitioning protein
MSGKRGGLGRSLSALLQASGETLENGREPSSAVCLLNVAVDALQPSQYQPRRVFDQTALDELSQSIQQQGLLQPLVVRASGHHGQYEIIAGERRWRACQLAGMQEIPVLVNQIDDKTAMAMALVENLQRESLSAMDQAHAMQRLTQEFSLTHQEIAQLLSKSRASVTNFLRLLHLHPNVQAKVEQGFLDMGHARCLLMLDEATQCEIADWVIDKQLSVRETEKLVSRLNTKQLASPEHAEPLSLFQDQLQSLSKQLNTKVSIKAQKSGKGQLIIHYQDSHRLREVIQQLTHVSMD